MRGLAAGGYSHRWKRGLTNRLAYQPLCSRGALIPRKFINPAPRLAENVNSRVVGNQPNTSQDKKGLVRPVHIGSICIRQREQQ
ncbi:hypothetical protein PpBr36_01322 [Pyricularia pennisetigena]|uniref:hypothetical protein n=1 Tax=Pyricularia pennisetigena TaxID=1578925 RepID=UPI00114D5B85|nr:hypothetical protein PpBr36_01322 [Pyricularia pennisetigena]TLS29285.1 hypothetical protein PpBr36_01322 [Pyricularia pennisetigena]